MGISPFFCLLGQSHPLRYAESVLFIGNCQPQPGKGHAVLQKGVGTNYDGELAAGQLLFDLPFRGCPPIEEVSNPTEIPVPAKSFDQV